jgi:hypothetical protein
MISVGRRVNLKDAPVALGAAVTVNFPKRSPGDDPGILEVEFVRLFFELKLALVDLAFFGFPELSIQRAFYFLQIRVRVDGHGANYIIKVDTATVFGSNLLTLHGLVVLSVFIMGGFSFQTDAANQGARHVSFFLLCLVVSNYHKYEKVKSFYEGDLSEYHKTENLLIVNRISQNRNSILLRKFYFLKFYP